MSHECDGFVWEKAGDGQWKLRCPFGCNAADVWLKSGGEVYWHTWDEHGTGGENSVEDSVKLAKLEVAAALLRQGWHYHRRRKPRDTP